MTPVRAAIACLCLISAPHAAAPVHWPGFRGPGASGIADASTLPVKWSTKERVAWVSNIPGRGWSSPIVWGGRVFVTSAVNTGGFKEPSTGIYGNDYAAELKAKGLSNDEINKRVIARDIELAAEIEDVRYMVFALDAATGKVVWEREAHKGKPSGGRHRKNTYASETPVTDGERVYASFGPNVGVFCFTMTGKLLWSKAWTPQPMYLDFGTASSPVVHNGRVYQLRDTQSESTLTSLDAKTGTVVWEVPRPTQEGIMKSGWSTPFIWETAQRTEIITIGKAMVVSYDLSGKELWRLRGITHAAPTPVAGGGLLFVGSGSQADGSRPMYAVKPGATGDISVAAGEARSPFIAWFQPRLGAYTPSPLFYRGQLYVVNDNGVMQVVDAITGAEIYRARVGGVGNTFSSSPFASNGRVYALSEDGDTFVFEAGREYVEVAKNSLGEMSFATPAADANSLYVRTQTRLYRITAPTAPR
jgi:outer membrane protein assembly factor BamB